MIHSFVRSFSHSFIERNVECIYIYIYIYCILRVPPNDFASAWIRCTTVCLPYMEVNLNHSTQ
jgi:hypothetical protein